MAKIRNRTEYYFKNKDKYIESARKWRENNPDLLKEVRRRAVHVFNYTPKGVYKVIRTNSIKKGLPICSREDFISWYEKEPRTCSYCEIKEENLSLLGFRRLEIDRKDNDKGYLIKNIVLACRICNSVKGKYISYDDMTEIGQVIRKIWKRKIQ